MSSGGLGVTGLPTCALLTMSHLRDIEHQVGVAAPLKGVQALAIIPEEVPPGGATRGQGHNEVQRVPPSHHAGGPWFLGFKEMGAVGPQAPETGSGS